MDSATEQNIFFVLINDFRFYENFHVCWNWLQVTHRDFTGHPKFSEMAYNGPLSYFFKDKGYNPPMNHSINAAQVIRNDAPRIASLFCEPKAEIQTLRIFSGAAKAITSPIIWNFTLTHVTHLA